ncbi:MAG: hypothetical protein ACFFCU_14335 [Promethearchaeota archaeon]
MRKIHFNSIRRESKFLNPLKGFQEDIHHIEHRQDPLTGTQSIIGKELEDKAKMFFGETDQNLIKKIAQESQVNCFMCPNKVREVTPKYSPEVLSEGRITIGEATLFPNLFPLSEYHAVCALSQTHYLKLSDFTPKILTDGILACLEFIKRIFSIKHSITYMTINCNYLFPAGASAVHPHIQVLGGDVSYTFLNKMLQGSHQYYKENHSNYWKDLIELEKDSDERYIGRTGDVEWITSFSPLGSNEVQGIVLSKSNFLQLSQADILSLGEGISKVLSFYEENGCSTFNFTIFSDSLDKEAEWFWVNVRIISRSNVYNNYRADDYFLQKLLGNEILIKSPEALAKQLRAKFYK